MARLFGTDGVRGVAGSELTADLARGLGRAAVRVLAVEAEHRPVLLIGRDPRESGIWLERELVGGVHEAGGDVLLAGVEPTPAIAEPLPSGGEGTIRSLERGRERYLAHLEDAAPARLDGMTIVVDCANGAASQLAPRLYERLGATV